MKTSTAVGKMIELLCNPCLNLLIIKVGAWRFSDTSRKTPREQLKSVIRGDEHLKEIVADFDCCGCAHGIAYELRREI